MDTRSQLLSFAAPGGEGGRRKASLTSSPSIRNAKCRTSWPSSMSMTLRALYGRIVGTTPMPNAGDELHHFGWNACSSCLCPNAPHPHAERRYLVVPGLRSSRIHILDVKPDPRAPQIVKVIEAAELAERAGYSRPHTVHCGPEGIYVSALGDARGNAPGRRVSHGPRDVRRARAMGDRARRPEVRLRRVVASRLRHARHQRMGHAGHDRERARAGAAARRQVRPAPALLGPAQAASSCRRSTSATSISSSSSCGRRTIRRRPTASSIAC